MRHFHVETRCNHSIAEVLHVFTDRYDISLFGIKFKRLASLGGCALRRVCSLGRRALLGGRRPLGKDGRLAVGWVVGRDALHNARHHVLDVPGGARRPRRGCGLEPRHHSLLERLLGRLGLLEGQVGHEVLVRVDLVGRKPVGRRDASGVPYTGRLVHAEPLGLLDKLGVGPVHVRLEGLSPRPLWQLVVLLHKERLVSIARQVPHVCSKTHVVLELEGESVIVEV